VELMENTLAVSLDSAAPGVSADGLFRFRLEARRKRLVTPDPIEVLDRMDGELGGLT
jgi:hypothetical protein